MVFSFDVKSLKNKNAKITIRLILIRVLNKYKSRLNHGIHNHNNLGIHDIFLTEYSYEGTRTFILEILDFFGKSLDF